MIVYLVIMIGLARCLMVRCSSMALAQIETDQDTHGLVSGAISLVYLNSPKQNRRFLPSPSLYRSVNSVFQSRWNSPSEL